MFTKKSTTKFLLAATNDFSYKTSIRAQKVRNLEDKKKRLGQEIISEAPSKGRARSPCGTGPYASFPTQGKTKGLSKYPTLSALMVETKRSTAS